MGESISNSVYHVGGILEPAGLARWGHLGACWGHPGSPLESSWGPLGPFLGVLRAPGNTEARPGALLEASGNTS